jgi:hypothetical protein
MFCCKPAKAAAAADNNTSSCCGAGCVIMHCIMHYSLDFSARPTTLAENIGIISIHTS